MAVISVSVLRAEKGRAADLRSVLGTYKTYLEKLGPSVQILDVLHGGPRAGEVLLLFSAKNRAEYASNTEKILADRPNNPMAAAMGGANPPAIFAGRSLLVSIDEAALSGHKTRSGYIDGRFGRVNAPSGKEAEMLRYLRPWLGWLLAWLRVRTDHAFEVAALKQQLAMYEGRRPDIRDSDRLFWVLLVRFFPRWRDSLVVVRPETVVRWHRAGWRRYWTWKSRPRRRGRPRIDPEARELILRLARENRTWGSVRIQGDLRALGHDVSAETVRRYRLQALRRPPSPNWRAFLHNHRHEIWASDFFTVPTISFTTLYVFFFVSHARRRIEHIHVTQHPTADWVWRQLIEATPWGHRPRFLVRDRDRAYGGGFIARARAIGIETVLTPVRAPKANAIAERLVLMSPGVV